MTAIVAEVLLGFLTFTGSLMAAGKLQEIKWIPQRPVTWPYQNVGNLALLAIAILCGLALILDPTRFSLLFPVIIVLALAFGVLLVLPIGGADMPTVISLLNSYAGLSAVALGFVLDNMLLVTAGALDGSSGLILSIIMCRAMNRSFTNVLFGAFGQVQSRAGGRRSQNRQERNARRGRPDHGAGQPGGDRPRLRHGGRPGPAPREGAIRLAHEARRRRAVCHSPGRRPHARPHERAAWRRRKSPTTSWSRWTRSTTTWPRPTWCW